MRLYQPKEVSFGSGTKQGAKNYNCFLKEITVIFFCILIKFPPNTIIKHIVNKLLNSMMGTKLWC